MFKHKMRFLVATLVFMMLLLGFGARVPVHAGSPPPAFQWDVLGVRLSYLPQETNVVRDQYMSSSFGFSVVDGKGRLLARVEWLHETSPAAMDDIASELRESFPDIPVRRSRTVIDGREAIVLSPIPGQVETAVVFVSANGRLYRIFYNTESPLGLNIVQGLTFIPPKGDLSALGRRKAEDALYDAPPWDWRIDPKKPTEESMIDGASRQEHQPQPQAYTPPGCVDFPTWKFLQTQWAWNANGSGTPYSQGWSKAGPSYFGEGLHVGCDRPNKLNDYFALDHPLKEWDIVYPPASGTVLYAGWAGGGWAGLDGGGDYWYISRYQWMSW